VLLPGLARARVVVRVLLLRLCSTSSLPWTHSSSTWWQWTRCGGRGGMLACFLCGGGWVVISTAGGSGPGAAAGGGVTCCLTLMRWMSSCSQHSRWQWTRWGGSASMTCWLMSFVLGGVLWSVYYVQVLWCGEHSAGGSGPGGVVGFGRDSMLVLPAGVVGCLWHTMLAASDQY
jgi:hypothetical protein